MNMLLPPPPALEAGVVSLFLDLDGTIVEIASRPDDVGPDQDRSRLLISLGQALDGRIAVLTGRTLADADHILNGAVIPTAAVHGLVRRTADGVIEAAPPARGIELARSSLTALAARIEGLLLEDKGLSLALHYRQAPQAQAIVLEETRRIAAETGLTVQDGAMVSELRTPGPNKGDSLAFFATLPAFTGFRPIMVGDDLTDEHAFAEAEARDGYGVLVGPPRPTQARFGLPNVDAVMAWLAGGAG